MINLDQLYTRNHAFRIALGNTFGDRARTFDTRIARGTLALSKPEEGKRRRYTLTDVLTVYAWATVERQGLSLEGVHGADPVNPTAQLISVITQQIYAFLAAPELDTAWHITDKGDGGRFAVMASETIFDGLIEGVEDDPDPNVLPLLPRSDRRTKIMTYAQVTSLLRDKSFDLSPGFSIIDLHRLARQAYEQVQREQGQVSDDAS